MVRLLLLPPAKMQLEVFERDVREAAWPRASGTARELRLVDARRLSRVLRRWGETAAGRDTDARGETLEAWLRRASLSLSSD